MIPRNIHFVWMGQSRKYVRRNIEIAKKKIPNGKFYVWNENNFDVNSSPYTKLAYEQGEYAFVSDYIRLWALYNYGGVYLDTDVIVLQDVFEDFSKTDQLIMGFEKRNKVGSSFIAAQKDNHIIKEFMNYCDGLATSGSDTIGKVANVVWITDFLKKNGLRENGKQQILKTPNSCIKLLPFEYYGYPNENSRLIHIMKASWVKEVPLSQKVGATMRNYIFTQKQAKLYNKFRTTLWKSPS